MTLASVNIGSLHIWKEMVLDEVRRAFNDTAMQQLQKETGVWAYGDRLRTPSSNQVQVLRNGCLNFIVDVAGEPVFFSVWMQPGEVRVGVKLPASFVLGDTHKDVYSRMFNGEPCQRITVIGKHIFFDWIWAGKDFASFDFMVESIDDDMKASVLAERIAQIVTHLHLATLSTLIDRMKFKLLQDGSITREGQLRWQVAIGGELSAFEFFVGRKDGSIISVKDGALGDQPCKIVTVQGGAEIEAPLKANVGGDIQDPDGGRCRVLRLLKVE